MASLVEAQDIMFTAFEPKLQNRYVFQLQEMGIPAFMVKAGNRPAISFDEVELHHMNVKHYVKGKATWDELEITLYDPVVPSAAQAVMEWIRLSHESVTGRDGYKDFYKKDVTINVLGPVGDKVEQWDLKQAWIKSANFGTLAFDSNEPVDITVSLRYDYAILQF
tara:strand:- start:2405 stop:2899 length:495 start_codon:yes stop_codon:yes gene_type:complete